VFMGARIGCARCHAHPVESWTADDDLGLGAWFARLGYKSTGEWKEEIVYPDFKGVLRHPRTRQPVDPRVPGGAAIKPAIEEDPRGRFAAWLTASDNPWFARNAANRIWFWLMGAGIVTEPDDLRPTNPPTNPELLAYLESELVSHRYGLKHLYRLILNSQTYQRSSEPNEGNARDTLHFSHYLVKRLGAEQMLDAVTQVTGVPEKFRTIIPEPYSNWPSDFKATQLADGNMDCSFLDLFGRPGRDTPYESERDSELTLPDALHAQLRAARRQTRQQSETESAPHKEGPRPSGRALPGHHLPPAYAGGAKAPHCVRNDQEVEPGAGRPGHRLGAAELQGIRIQPLRRMTYA